MKAQALTMVLVGALMAGCTLGGEPANPNLLVPKVLLNAPQGGNVTVYVHSAFGEHDYDWLTLSVDNVTVAERADAFSLEEQVLAEGFFLSVRAGASGQVYELSGRVDLDESRQKAHVAFLDKGGTWDDPRAFNLPLERLLDRVTGGASP